MINISLFLLTVKLMQTEYRASSLLECFAEVQFKFFAKVSIIYIGW